MQLYDTVVKTRPAVQFNGRIDPLLTFLRELEFYGNIPKITNIKLFLDITRSFFTVGDKPAEYSSKLTIELEIEKVIRQYDLGMGDWLVCDHGFIVMEDAYFNDRMTPSKIKP